MAQRVLLTGATGLLGRELLPRLVHRGITVHAASRAEPSALTARPGVHWIRADVTDANALAPLASEVDVIVHAAGDMRPDDAGNFAVNRDATRSLLRSASRGRAKRFVYVSSVAVYGDLEQIETREDAPRLATHGYGRSKRDAEDLVFAAHRGEGLSTCVVRPCPILGTGAGHFASGVRSLVSQPTVPLPDAGRRKIDLVDAADVADLVVKLALDRAERNGAFHAAAGDALTLREILALAAESIGATPHWQDVAIDVALAANAEAADRGEGPAVPPALIAFAAVERTYSIDRAVRGLGFRPTPPSECLPRRVQES